MKNARAWYRNGKLHREDGPASEGPLGKIWHLNGKKHRVDGPAVEMVDGTKQWFRHGKELTEAKFLDVRKRELGVIEDAFKKGLDRNVAVPRPVKFKKR